VPTRKAQMEDQLEAKLKTKIDDESGLPEEKSQLHIFTYLEHHLKAELAWLKSLKKGTDADA
jgi:hypothetical protein